MPTINIHAAKTHLSRLLDAAAAGEEVIIARTGKPVALLVPVTPVPPKRRPGLLAGKLPVADDFDDPLPGDVLAGFEGR